MPLKTSHCTYSSGPPSFGGSRGFQMKTPAPVVHGLEGKRFSCHAQWMPLTYGRAQKHPEIHTSNKQAMPKRAFVQKFTDYPPSNWGWHHRSSRTTPANLSCYCLTERFKPARQGIPTVGAMRMNCTRSAMALRTTGRSTRGCSPLGSCSRRNEKPRYQSG